MNIELSTTNTTQQRANITHISLRKGEYTKNVTWPYDGFFLTSSYNKTKQLVLIVDREISQIMSLSKSDDYNTVLNAGGSLR